MGNEMGNQNVTGLQEDDAKIETTESVREDVRRNDISGENQVVQENERKGFHEKVKTMDSYSPMPEGDPSADNQISERTGQLTINTKISTLILTACILKCKPFSNLIEQEIAEIQPADMLNEKDCDGGALGAAFLSKDLSDREKPIDSKTNVNNLISDGEVQYTKTQLVEGFLEVVEPNESMEDSRAWEDSRDKKEPIHTVLEANDTMGTCDDQNQEPESIILETATVETPKSEPLESINLASDHRELADTRAGLAVDDHCLSRQGSEGSLGVNLTCDNNEQGNLIENKVAQVVAEATVCDAKAESGKGADESLVKEDRSKHEQTLDISIGETKFDTEGDENKIGENEMAKLTTAVLLSEFANNNTIELIGAMHIDEQDHSLLDEKGHSVLPTEAIHLANSLNSHQNILTQEAMPVGSGYNVNEFDQNTSQFHDESLTMDTKEIISGSDVELDHNPNQFCGQLASESKPNGIFQPEILMTETNLENKETEGVTNFPCESMVQENFQNEERKMVENSYEISWCIDKSNLASEGKCMTSVEMSSTVDLVLTTDNVEEEGFIEKEINIEQIKETKEYEHGMENEAEEIEAIKQYTSQYSQVLAQNQQKCDPSDMARGGFEGQETGGRLSTDTDPESKKTVTPQLQKSPSFDFNLLTEARTEECDQTPLLYNEKTSIGSLSSKMDVENRNTVTEYTQDSSQCQPMVVEDKRVKFEKSDSGKSRTPFLSLMKEEDEAKIMVKSQKDSLDSAKKKDKRKMRPSLFGTCMCCASVNVMH